MHDLRGHLVGAELRERLHDRLDRALHVALDDDREELLTLHLQAVHHLLERAARAGRACAAIFSRRRPRRYSVISRARALVLHHAEAVAGFRRRLEAQHLDRRRGAGLAHLLAAIVDQRAHAAPFGAGDDDVADMQRAALDEHGRHRSAAAVELRFHHDAFRRRGRGLACRFRISACSRIASSSLSRLVCFSRRDLDFERLAAHRFDHDLVAAAARCGRGSDRRPACRSC